MERQFTLSLKGQCSYGVLLGYLDRDILLVRFMDLLKKAEIDGRRHANRMVSR